MSIITISRGSYSKGKEKYIAFIQATICRHFLKDNVAYYGLAGHFFVGSVSHALRVRIIADLAYRVKNSLLSLKQSSAAQNIMVHFLIPSRKWVLVERHCSFGEESYPFRRR